MKTRVLASCLSLLVGLAAPAGAATAFKDKWALVVGISKFKDNTVSLKYGAKDARDFYNYLISQGHFEPDHVGLLLDEEATRANVIATIGERWLPRVARPDDLVVIYISTHGSASDPNVGGVNYLIAHDTSSENPHASGIAMQDLAQLLKERVHSDHVVVVLDACHSGNAASDAKGLARPADTTPDKVFSKGELVICSSKPTQTSWESKDYPNGVFTHCLIESLKSRGEQTTIEEAFNKMKQGVEEEVLRDRGSLQTPVMSGDSASTQIALAMVGSQRMSVPPELRPPGAPPPEVVKPKPPQPPPAPPKPLFAEHLWQTYLQNAQRAKEEGHYAEADTLMSDAAKEIEKADESDSRFATTFNTFAELKLAEGKYAGAEPLFRKALESRERAAGATSPQVGETLNGLGNLLLKKGNYVEAEAVLRRAIAIREKQSQDSDEVAQSLILLGNVLLEEGKFGQVKDVCARVRSIVEHHPKGALKGSYLVLAGKLALANGKASDAKKLFQQSLDLQEQTSGENHPNLIDPINALSSLYVYQRRYTDAEPLLYRSLAISEALSPDHPSVADSLEELALIGELKHKYQQAESNYKRALEIREKALGPDHPLVARSLTDLAWLKYAQEDYPQADSLFRRAQTILEKSNTASSPRSIATLEYYSYLLKSTSRRKQATELALKIKQLKAKQRQDNPGAKGDMDSSILAARVSAMSSSHGKD